MSKPFQIQFSFIGATIRTHIQFFSTALPGCKMNSYVSISEFELEGERTRRLRAQSDGDDNGDGKTLFLPAVANSGGRGVIGKDGMDAAF